MYFSDETVEEVRARNDIVDLISSYVQLRRNGANYLGLCPFHNEKTPSFSVSPGKQLYYCFGCHAGGNAISFLMQYENMTFQEAVAFLADRCGYVLPEENEEAGRQKKRDEKMALFEINKLATGFFYRSLFGQEGLAARQYFESRGLGKEIWKRFGLGYAHKQPDALYRYIKGKGYDDDILQKSGLFTYDGKGVRNKFWNRVIFPIADKQRRVIAFGGRVMGDGMPKYLNSPQTPLFDKSKSIYGIHIAAASRSDFLLLCEGYMDVISLHQEGFDNAVATLGTAFTKDHSVAIKRLVKKVVLCYDEDNAGIQAIQRALPILREAEISARVLCLSPWKDPDELIRHVGKEGFQERINEAENAFLWEIRQLKAGYLLSDPEQKTEFYKGCGTLLSRFEDPLERGNYIRAVSDREGIPFEELRRLVNRYGSRGGNVMPEDPRERKKNFVKREDGLYRSQKLLLAWLAEEGLFEKIARHITPSDFLDPFLSEIAEKLYEMGERGTIQVSSLLDEYTENPEKSSIVSGLFHVREAEKLLDEDKKKAIEETILKLRQARLDQLSRSVQDITSLQKIIQEQSILKTRGISLD